VTRVSTPDTEHLGASAVGHRRFQCLRRHGEIDEGNATRPLHRQHLGEQRFVAAAQAAGDGDRLAAESKLPRAGRGAKRGECELRKRLSTISSLAPRSGLAFPIQNDLGTQKPWGAFPRVRAKTPFTPRPPKAGPTTAVINPHVRMPPDTTEISLADSSL
jgi:hypothetical protein